MEEYIQTWLYMWAWEKRNALTCHLGMGANIWLLRLGEKATCCLDIHTWVKEKRQHSKTNVTYKPYNILLHSNNQSHTGILLLIAAILAVWKVFPRYVIRIWKKLIRWISLGKTSWTLQSLGLKWKKVANYVSIPLNDCMGSIDLFQEVVHILWP